MGDEQQLVQQLAINLWFRQTDYVWDEKGNLVSSERDPTILKKNIRSEGAGRGDDVGISAGD